MQTNIITLTTSGEGMEAALKETERTAEQVGLDHAQTLELRLISEEMMAMLRSITHELSARFWIDWEDRRFALHLSARQRLSNTQRNSLLKASTTGKNEAVQSFLDKLRDVFEQALAVDHDVSNYYSATGYGYETDISDEIILAEPWDEFEKSLLLSLADTVKIGIKGGAVDMTIEKAY